VTSSSPSLGVLASRVSILNFFGLLLWLDFGGPLRGFLFLCDPLLPDIYSHLETLSILWFLHF